MNTECKIKQCHLCNERCPQAEMADEIARGRMFATKELIACQKELEAYREIGTLEECRAAVERITALAPQLEKLKEECADPLQEYDPEYFVNRAIKIVKGAE